MVEVAITYAWFTRFIGTPLIENGPVTRRRPEGSCFRKTTRRPRKRPDSRMSTVPGVMLLRSFAIPRDAASRADGALVATSSAG